MGAGVDAFDDRVRRSVNEKLERINLRTVCFVDAGIERGFIPAVNEGAQGEVSVGTNEVKASRRGEREIAILFGVALRGKKAGEDYDDVQRDEQNEQGVSLGVRAHANAH